MRRRKESFKIDLFWNVNIAIYFWLIEYILVYWFCHRFFVGDVDFIELLLVDGNLTGGIILDRGGAIINVGRIMRRYQAYFYYIFGPGKTH